VVHGSQAGAAGGGQAAATGAGLHQLPQLPQQQHPALLSTSTASADRNDILIMASVSLPENSVELTTAIADSMFGASDARSQCREWPHNPTSPRMMCKRNG
jgi:hypothetical protein